MKPECKSQANYLLEALVNVEFGLGMLQRDDPSGIYFAKEEMQKARERLIDGLADDKYKPAMAKIEEALQALKKEDRSIASTAMIMVSDFLQRNIPETIVDCECSEKNR